MLPITFTNLIIYSEPANLLSTNPCTGRFDFIGRIKLELNSFHSKLGRESGKLRSNVKVIVWNVLFRLRGNIK